MMKKDFYEMLLENLYDGVYYVDRDKRITFWNKSAERITGYRREDVLCSKCSDNILCHLDERGKELCIDGCPLAETLRDGKIREADVYLHHKDGFRVPVSIRVSPIFDEQDSVVGAVEIFSDNAKRTEIIRELEHLKKEVYVDPLTEIGNRRFAKMSLHHRFQELVSYRVPFGILFLDIDHFKAVNDTYGHEVGDNVLKMAAMTISSVLRSMDVLARWGGEEFLVIVPNVSRNILRGIAERICKFVAKSWLTVNGRPLMVTVSIGGAMASEEDTLESLLSRADALMYSSKQAGRNRVSLEGDVSD